MAASNLPQDFFMRPIPLRPHYSPRPWGGERLKTVLGKDLPADQGPIGESWELSDHPSGRSVVGGDSPAAGMTFGELLRAHPIPMIGRDEAPETYPMLIKYIDAQGDLSVQVHPDDAWCRETGHPDRGKSECWYVMHCEPGAKLIYGYKPGVDEATVREAIKQKNFTELLDFRPIQPGDFIAVPPKTVHAMLSGTMICEIQQSSNTTFRLYDWDREPPRELHIDDSMAVSEFDPSKLPPFKHLGAIATGDDAPASRVEILLQNEYFRVVMHDVAPGRTVEDAALCHPTGSILNVVGGSGSLRAGGVTIELELGQTWFLPAAMANPAVTASDAGLRVLVSTSEEV